MTIYKKENESILRPWEAFLAPTERVSLQAAEGRKSASTIRQYPPGIPEIIPGMTLSRQALDALMTTHTAGGEIVGIDMTANPQIDVILETQKRQPKLNIQTFLSQDISRETSNRIADFFRVGFSSAPYFHYAFHESDPLQSLPCTLNFESYSVSVALSDPMKRKDCQNALRGIAIDKAVNSTLPLDGGSISLPKGFHRWTDKIVCREKITDRLLDAGYVTLVTNTQTGQLAGLLHSRLGTLERLFLSEEWSDPLLFSAYHDPQLQDDPERFYDKIEYHFGLKPNDVVMTISAQILAPEAQGGETFYDMMRSMAHCVTPEHAKLPLLSEIPPYGTAHTINTAMNDRLVYGVLKNDHPVVFCEQFAHGLFPLIGEKKHWQHIIRKAVLEKRHYRKKYFVPLSTDNTNVAVRPNGKLGLAVFAMSDIDAGSRIAVFTGEKYKSETALGLPEIMRDHAIQIGADEYVFGHKGLAHCLCHSCDPNCGIRGLTEIFAVRDILKGEQVTWDYRCSENSNWVLETCLCGSDRCTGSVGNHDSLPKKIKAEYSAKGMVSDWLTPH